MSEPTAEQPQVTATVSPATPPRSRWGAIPDHLGRARTSTVVLSLLFLAIGALWVNVRPEVRERSAETPTVVVDQPVVPFVPVPTAEPTFTEPAPTTTPEPTVTTEAPTTAPTDVPSPTTSDTAVPTTTTSEPPAPLPEPTGTPAG